MWLIREILACLKFLASGASEDQYRPDSCGIGGIDIEMPVADHKRLFQIQIKVLPGLEEHSGSRLSALTAGIRTMRAIINCVEDCIVTRKLGSKDIMNLMNHGFIKITASYAGLVRNENCFRAALVDPAHCRTGPGKGFV